MPEGRNSYSKTKPIQYEEFQACLDWWNNREENEFAWKISVEKILQYGESGELLNVNLDEKNPNAQNALEHLPPEELIEDILHKERQVIDLLEEIKLSLTGALV